MIVLKQGNNILSKYSNAELYSIEKGFVVKCYPPNENEICYDLLGIKYADHGQLNEDFPTRKPRTQFYLMYTKKTFKETPHSKKGIIRTKYSLIDGTPIYTNDCDFKDLECEENEVQTVLELFNMYNTHAWNEMIDVSQALSQGYRKKKLTKPTSRKPKKVVKKCKCK